MRSRIVSGPKIDVPPGAKAAASLNKLSSSIVAEGSDSNDPLNVFAAMAVVQNELGGVGKDRTKKELNFSYRGVDDVFNAVHPLLGRHGVVLSPQVIEHSTEPFTGYKNGSWTMATVKVRYVPIASDGTHYPIELCPVVVSQGVDNSDKAFGKAMSYAYKVGVSQLFSIPTDDPAMDNEYTQAPAKRDAWGGGWATEADHDRAKHWLVGTLRENFADNQAALDQAVSQGLLEINAEGERVVSSKMLTKSKATALKHFLKHEAGAADV